MTKPDILEENPFSKPPLADKGDPVARETYVQVAHALTRWEYSEIKYTNLFLSFVLPDGGLSHGLQRAFGVVISANTKRDLIAAGAEVFFETFPNDDLSKNLKRFLNVYRDASARRNEIAHGIVQTIIPPLPEAYFLTPGIHSTKKTEPFLRGAKYRYSSRELKQMALNFTRMGESASRLRGEVLSFYKSLPETLRKQHS